MTTNTLTFASKKAFDSAVKKAFDGIKTRQDTIQSLLLAALANARKPRVDDATKSQDDFSWFTTIAVMAEETKGLNLKKIVDYIRAMCDNSIVFDTKERVFRKHTKGTVINYMTPDVPWYEFGKAQRIEDSWNLSKYLGTVQSQLQKHLGELPPEAMKLLNDITELQQKLAQAKLEAVAEESAPVQEAQAQAA